MVVQSLWPDVKQVELFRDVWTEKAVPPPTGSVAGPNVTPPPRPAARKPVVDVSVGQINSKLERYQETLGYPVCCVPTESLERLRVVKRLWHLECYTQNWGLTTTSRKWSAMIRSKWSTRTWNSIPTTDWKRFAWEWARRNWCLIHR
jgi:hypothetical protein